ncbi:MAG: hypothetical protein IJ659_07545 [Alloprevotella sp.]|nr:hypothetical protein [Alloprevotella sp.]
MRRIVVILLTALMVSGQWSVLKAQKKDGHWVNPVEYFKLKGAGTLKGSALYSHMWETKERYIVGMKCTVCNFTPQGDEPENADLPFTPSTVYLYINEAGAMATVSDWSTLPNGKYLGVYKVGATGIRYTFNEKTHGYSFDYTPEGSYDYDGSAAGMGNFSSTQTTNHTYADILSEHGKAIDRTDMGLFYTDRGGLRGYIMNVVMREDNDIDDQTGEIIVHKYEDNPHYLQFTVDEVLIDGTDTPLTETERQSLIDQMDMLADWLQGKGGDPLGLGEHTDATESAVIEIIGVIGSVLLANGIAAASGGAAGAVLPGMMGAPTGGGPSPTMPDMPNSDLPNLKREEEEDEAPPLPNEGDGNPPEQNLDFYNKYAKEQPDGTVTISDPISGKTLTYYPTPDGKLESELGTVYDKESLNENIRYRQENAGLLKQDADQAAKNAAEQHAQWEKDSKELSQTAKDYQDWKHAQEDALRKEEKINALADKYGVPPTEKAVRDAIKWEQTSAQLDANIANSDAEAYEKSLETLDKIDKTAEVMVNVMGETVPGGRVVKNVYTFAKATGVAASEAYNQDMSLGDAAKHVGMGAASGAVGVLQNQAGELTKNPFVEGVAVVGGESIRAGLDAIAHDKDVNDAMLQAAGKKAAFFVMGKSVQFGLGQSGYQPPEMGENTSNAVEKFLGKGGMHADWGNLASSNAVHVTEGIASAAQEAPMTFGGFDKAGEGVQNLAYGVSSDTKSDVKDFVKSVKDFSNAAEKFRKKQ